MAISGFFGRDVDPARTSAGAVLDDISVAATWKTPDPEAGEIVVPNEVVDVSGFGSFNDPFGEFRHGLPLLSALLPVFTFGAFRRHIGSKRGRIPASLFIERAE
jgi:hypothetical protein